MKLDKILLLAFCLQLFITGTSQIKYDKSTSSVFTSKKDFSTKDASVTIVTPGRKNGVTNYSYTISLISKKKDTITFDSMWISGNRLQLLSSKNGLSADSTTTLEEGDIISLKANQSIKGSLPVNRSTSPKAGIIPVIASPISYEGAALIRYYIGTTKYYYIIKSITKKRINLP